MDSELSDRSRKMDIYGLRIEVLKEYRASLCEGSLPLIDLIDLSEEESMKLKGPLEPAMEAIGSLVELIIQDLEQGRENLYLKLMSILKDKDYNSYLPIECSYALKILNNSAPFLIKNIRDVKPFLEYLPPCLSIDEVDKINSTLNRGEKISSLLDFIQKRLLANDISLYETFIESLAGLSPEAFKCLCLREPLIEDAEKCIITAKEGIRNDIIKKGHVTDKKGDKTIVFEKNFIKLCLTEQEDKDKKLNWDRQSPAAYQQYISDDSKRRNVQPEEILDDTQSYRSSRPFPDSQRSHSSTHHRITMMQGRAGIGKTTLVQYLSQQWANKHWAKDYQLIFLVQLRILMTVKTELSLHDLLTSYSIYSSGEDNLPYLWLQNWGQTVLIQVDGLDEIGDFSKNVKNTRVINSITEKATALEIIINLLRGDLLPSCHIVCASRPFEGLHDLDITRDLEVMGLTQEKVFEFIKANLDPERAKKCLPIFQENPLLLSLCAITYYCSDICQLLSEGQWIQENEIMSYTRLTANIVMSHVQRESGNIEGVLEYKDCLRFLADMAFSGIFDECNTQGICRLTYDLHDILSLSGSCRESLEQAQRAGLINKTEILLGQQTRPIWEYAHLSLQELFASLKLLTYSSENEEIFQKYVDQVSTDGRLNMLWLFLYGLAFDAQSHEINNLKACMGNQNYEHCKHVLKKVFEEKDVVQRKHQILHRAQTAYEAQNSEISDLSMAVSESGILDMNNTPINAVDMTALLHATKSADGLQSIQFNNSNLDVHSTVLLCQHLQDITTVKSLDLGNNQITEDGLIALSEALSENATIEYLNLDGNNIDNKCLAILSAGLSCEREVFGISLRDNKIGDAGAALFVQCLANTKKKKVPTATLR